MTQQGEDSQRENDKAQGETLLKVFQMGRPWGGGTPSVGARLAPLGPSSQPASEVPGSQLPGSQLNAGIIWGSFCSSDAQTS